MLFLLRSLLSILDKSNHSERAPSSATGRVLPSSQTAAVETPPPKISRKSGGSGSGGGAKNGTATMEQSTPSWLNISLDAALGFRANVFQINRVATGKKSSGATAASSAAAATESSIAIHSGASGVVSRHTLEVLVSLAKSFSTHFLPSIQSKQDKLSPVSFE